MTKINLEISPNQIQYLHDMLLKEIRECERIYNVFHGFNEKLSKDDNDKIESLRELLSQVNKYYKG